MREEDPANIINRKGVPEFAFSIPPNIYGMYLARSRRADKRKRRR